MGIKDLKAKTASVAARQVERTEANEIRTAPVRQYDITARMHEAERKVTELESRLKDAKAGNSQEIELDQLITAPGRKRNLSQGEFTELVENLRNNPLVTPITVRPVNDGKYEIVSGHNRVAAFRELGRASILAVVMDAEDVQADLNAFYANLLQPSLPDYEKFLGFCMIKAHRPELTHEEIADMAGISRQQVTKLMAFSALPDQGLKALEQNPRALGANAAADLASLAKAGKADQVTKAIEMLSVGEIDQATAIYQVTKAATAPTQKSSKAKAEMRTVKQGRTTYCNLRRAEKMIRLDFKTPEEAATAEQAIYELLESIAKKEGN